MAQLLLIEDTPILARMYQEALEELGHSVIHASTATAALESLHDIHPDLALLDLHLPDMDGLEVLARLREGAAPCDVIVITAYSSINVAVSAMRNGARDFLAKPFPVERLLVTVSNVLESNRMARELARLKDGEGRNFYHGFIGSSAIMQAVYRVIDNVAASKAAVFITGESGTGKEVCAEAIHMAGPRGARPFVTLNCAAIPRDLIESEVFGHVRGAFTGAVADRQGAAMQADGGTLFLDEICEMELPLQAKLLRFLQTFNVTPIGSNRTHKVDVRVIAATNRDPMQEVEAGRFREDLYYRLHVVPLALPRLAERGDDVIRIARKFLRDCAAEEGKSFVRLAPEVERCFLGYGWPGNVRQLQNVIRNVVALNNGPAVTLDMLPEAVRTVRTPLAAIPEQNALALRLAEPIMLEAPTARDLPMPQLMPLWQIERMAIEQALVECQGNIPRAAALLEVSPSTIYRKRIEWSGSGGGAEDAVRV